MCVCRILIDYLLTYLLTLLGLTVLLMHFNCHFIEFGKRRQNNRVNNFVVDHFAEFFTTNTRVHNYWYFYTRTHSY